MPATFVGKIGLARHPFSEPLTIRDPLIQRSFR